MFGCSLLCQYIGLVEKIVFMAQKAPEKVHFHSVLWRYVIQFGGMNLAGIDLTRLLCRINLQAPNNQSE